MSMNLFNKKTNKGKAFPQENNENRQNAGEVENHAYSGLGQLKHKVRILQVFILLLFAFGFWNDYSWREHANRIADKQWVVFDVKRGEATPTDALNYQTGPSTEEILAKALKIVKLIKGAGTNNADTYYNEARELMTQQMRLQFDDEFRKREKALKELGIYRQLENVTVKPLSEIEVPKGYKPSRYEVYVAGTLDTYRQDSKEKLTSGPFAFRVKLVPLDRRTIQNPSALLVESLYELDSKKDAGNDLTQNTNPTEK